MSIFMLIGTALTIGGYRLVFKTGISFFTGIFFCIQSILVGFIVRIDIIDDRLWDAILGLALMMIAAFTMAFIFDKTIGSTFREMSKKIKTLSNGKLNVKIDDKQLKYKSEAGEIARSLQELIESLNQGVNLVKMVSKGELFFDIDKLRDEADLDEALHYMVIKLREISGDVKQASQHVKQGSAELSKTAQQLAQGANEQAASAEEIATAMEEMQISNENNTENAEQTNKIATNVANDIKIVNDSIEKTNMAMSNIAEKISIITEIAEKTDILAINAAIEAARAGESGKGFAVVASEVRDLAEHSQKAADEIVRVTNDSMKQVTQSKDLLDKVYPEVQRTSILVDEIAAASREQSKGITEVNTGIQQLSSVIQQNSSSSEEMAASSEELNSQSERLNETISFFKINEADKVKFSKAEIKSQIVKLTELLESDNFSENDDANTINQPLGNQSNNNNNGIKLDMDDDGEYEEY